MQTSCQDTDATRPAHVVIAGVAGSGKSTLGRALARDLGAPILDLDTLTTPLLDAIDAYLPGGHWNGPTDASDDIRVGRYAVLRSAAAELGAIGQRCVLVAPFTRELGGGQEWTDLLAALAPVPVAVVHVDGAPDLLARRRAARGLARDDHRLDTSRQVPAIPHVRVDSALSTAQQLFRVRRALGLSRPPVDRGVLGRDFDAMVFDLDGTVVDSTAAVARSWDRVGVEYGFDVQDIAHGMTAAESMRLLLGDRGPEAALRLGDIESRDVDDVVPTPGALDVLSVLPAARTAIVTSGSPSVAGARLAAAGIAAPPVMVTSADVTHGKPDPEPYLTAARLLGVEPERCLVVEDAPAGARSARAAGCAVIGVGGTNDRSELEVDLEIDSLDQLRVEVQNNVIRVELHGVEQHQDGSVQDSRSSSSTERTLRRR